MDDFPFIEDCGLGMHPAFGDPHPSGVRNSLQARFPLRSIKNRYSNNFMLLKEGISPPHYYHKKISINRRESERLKKPVVPLLQLVSRQPIMLAPTQKCAFLSLRLMLTGRQVVLKKIKQRRIKSNNEKN